MLKIGSIISSRPSPRKRLDISVKRSKRSPAANMEDEEGALARGEARDERARKDGRSSIAPRCFLCICQLCTSGSTR